MDDWRKKLKFRSWHRGMKEADIILGRFADVYLPQLTKQELYQFDALLACTDHVLLDWINGRVKVPEEYDNNIMKLLKNFDFRVQDS
ncbi:MAG: succinate dehydrogenase assembly factor 2 [Alphaproteobacteria bacterium]|nr:MAG: succinate dehydrogenase assembly factor 2 [Alphaproteobacteria bacterium]